MAVYKKIAGIAFAALVAAAAMAPASEAAAEHRRHYRHNNGDALIAGVAGVLLGAAIASPGPVYAVPQGPVYYVEPQPVYVEPVPVYRPPYHSVTEPYRVEPQERVYRQPYSQYQPQPDYRQPRHHNSGPKVVTYDDTVGSGDGGFGASYEPWTQAWYDYCSDKYRSFDPQTGTYKGYDGLRHFCVVR